MERVLCQFALLLKLIGSPALFFQEKSRDFRRLGHTALTNGRCEHMCQHACACPRVCPQNCIDSGPIYIALIVALGVNQAEVFATGDTRVNGSVAGAAIRMWANREPYGVKTWEALFAIMERVSHEKMLIPFVKAIIEEKKISPEILRIE